MSETQGWSRHHGQLLRVLRHLYPDAGSAIEDVLQELWLYLLRAPPPDEVAADPTRLAAWLAGAARRRLFDHIRKETRHRRVALEDGPTIDSAATTRSGSWALNERVERALMNLVASGHEESALLLAVRYLDGLSPAEIGGVLGLSPRVVSARLQRAKKAFRREWRSTGGGARG